MRVWYLMWYLADTAAVFGDETALLPDEHVSTRVGWIRVAMAKFA
jgi:hypothetical protein